jgi:WD40 repeat protein
MTRAFNPYVGPHPIAEHEKIYGRNREIAQLTSLIIAERIVLLYSPSGAGKTSLIQAGLIPHLREDFYILPIVRVKEELPRQLAEANRYLMSTLQWLEKELPEADRRSIETLAQLSLDEYLNTRPRPVEARKLDLLIFDQFEEILTTAPSDRQGKLAFFDSLGEALKNQNRWALFAAREDFLGVFAPYIASVPTRLSNTFRLDLLGPEAALEAIREPSRTNGVEFTKAAAEELMNNLRRTRIQNLDGSVEIQTGEYVEPIQLQVVCRRLWQKLNEDHHIIDKNDLDNMGDVDESLAAYYEDSVKQAALEGEVDERIIREWFSKQLITKEGFRSQVQIQNTRGLDIDVVRNLEDMHILRAERRAGTTWFELSHDRMIEPIKKNNAAWEMANLSQLQRQAALWTDQGYPEGLLLRGAELKKAETEVKDLSLTEPEKKFLEACRKLQRAERQAAWSRHIMAALALLMLVFGIAAIGSAFNANDNAQKARQQATEANYARASATFALGAAEIAQNEAQARALLAQAGELAGQAEIALRGSDTVRKGQLLAVEAYDANRNANTLLDAKNMLPSVYQSLLTSAGKGNDLLLNNGDFSTASFSQDNNWLLVDSTLWNLKDTRPTELGLGSETILHSVFTSPEQAILMTRANNYQFSSSAYNVYFINIISLSKQTLPLIIPDLAYATDWDMSADGRWVAVSYTADDPEGFAGVSVWDLQNPSSNPTRQFSIVSPVTSQGATAKSVAIAPDGSKLAVLDTNSRIYLWKTGPSPTGTIPLNFSYALVGDAEKAFFTNGTFSTTQSAKGLQYSPDGKWLAVGTVTGIKIFDADSQKIFTGFPLTVDLKMQEERSGYLFSPDSQYIFEVTSGFDFCASKPSKDCQPYAAIKRWKIEKTAKPTPIILYKNLNIDITTLDINSSGKLAVGDKIGYVRAWDIQQIVDQAIDPVLANNAHAGSVANLLVSPDGENIVSAGEKDVTRYWKLISLDSVAIIINRTSNSLTSALRSADGNELVIGGKDTSGTSIWDLHNPKAATETQFTTQEGNLQALAFNSHWVASSRKYSTTSYYYSNTTKYFIDLWKRDTSNNNNAPLTIPMSASINALALDTAEKYLALASDTGKVQLIPLSEVNVNAVTPAPTPTSVNNFFPDTPTPQPVVVPTNNLPNDLGSMVTLQFSQNGAYLFGASAGKKDEDNGVSVWDMQTEAHPQIILPEARYPIQFSPDGQLVATGSAEQNILVWDLKSKAVIHALDTLTNATRLAFSADQRWLAAATLEQKIFLFDLQAAAPEKEPFILEGHSSEITWLEFSPDGKWLASSSDTTVHLWDITNPYNTPIILSGHTGYVVYAGFINGSDWIITAATDQTVRFWSTDLDELRKASCSFAVRNLKYAEWIRYFPLQTYRPTCKDNLAIDNIKEVAAATPRVYPTAGLLPTRTLTPTPAVVEMTYTVKAGDNLYYIASLFGIDIQALMQENKITDPNIIQIGQVFKHVATVTPAPTPTP